jgi:type IV secretion system protein VirB9
LVRQYASRREKGEEGSKEGKQKKLGGSKGVEVGASVESLNFNYAFVLEDPKDPPRWMPKRVFDDGRKTYIQFPRGFEGEAPALFILSKQGKPQVVNYRKRGEFYVVDRLFDAAQLRLGEKDPVTVGIERGEADKGEVVSQ